MAQDKCQKSIVKSRFLFLSASCHLWDQNYMPCLIEVIDKICIIKEPEQQPSCCQYNNFERLVFLLLLFHFHFAAQKRNFS